MAQSQLLGGEALVALDRQRADVAAAALSAVPGVPATTAAGLARRFGAGQVAEIERANAHVIATAHRCCRRMAGRSCSARSPLTWTPPT